MPEVQDYFNGKPAGKTSRFNSQRVNSSTLSKESKSKKILQWQQPLNHTFLYGLNYAYRANT